MMRSFLMIVRYNFTEPVANMSLIMYTKHAEI